MEIKVYVNWDERQILSESEFSEMIADKTQEKIDDDYELSYYLEHATSYTYAEVFRLTSEEKDKIYNAFKGYCESEIETDVLNENDWTEEFIKI